MNWYYALNDQQIGPVSDSDFANLVANGTIQSETRVWREGMADWQPLSQVPDAPRAATSSHPLTDNDVHCPNCGTLTKASTLIPVGNDKTVCPSCREQYLQQVREGVTVQEFGNLEGELAGFWIRAGAVIIDGIILNVVQYGIGFILGFAVAAASGGDALGLVELIASLVGVVINFAYAIGFLGSKMQATPGMKLLKLRICTSEGERVGYGRATGRAFAAILSGIILGIGYLMCAWDSEKRTLHDMICDTRVIRTF
ncbi:RDD family protein [Rubellicoccus peritrichatus]|uniref:RDD family protein n=1 Tax=Rubellicoccus peritrichatus TaxID=3080537 RepID=A0AAQ3QUA1_9BACT|nr:RDD family protein [Puniceicoccus sp. CR14]WOO42181.1 RDD family protein [Puniceicoccus sp. CR14]